LFYSTLLQATVAHSVLWTLSYQDVQNATYTVSGSARVSACTIVVSLLRPSRSEQTLRHSVLLLLLLLLLLVVLLLPLQT